MIPIPPALLKMLMSLVIAFGVFTSGYVLGSRHVKQQWTTANLKQQQKVEKVEVKQAEVTTQVVTQYVDRVQYIQAQPKIITKEVVKYVPLSTPALPPGWRLLHDSAALGLPIPDPSRIADAAPVSAQDAATTVAGNYATCNATAEQLKALQSWVGLEYAASQSTR